MINAVIPTHHRHAISNFLNFLGKKLFFFENVKNIESYIQGTSHDVLLQYQGSRQPPQKNRRGSQDILSLIRL